MMELSAFVKGVILLFKITHQLISKISITLKEWNKTKFLHEIMTINNGGNYDVLKTQILRKFNAKNIALKLEWQKHETQC